MDTHTRLHEHISALADGELAAGELELAFVALDTESGRQAWNVYQQIGHALRSGHCGCELSAGFGGGLADRLAVEVSPAASSCASIPLVAGGPAVAELLDANHAGGLH